MLDFRQAVESGHEADTWLAILQPAVQFVPEGARQAGDFTVPGHGESRGLNEINELHELHELHGLHGLHGANELNELWGVTGTVCKRWVILEG
jgi:hypothetical protein